MPSAESTSPLIERDRAESHLTGLSARVPGHSDPATRVRRPRDGPGLIDPRHARRRGAVPRGRGHACDHGRRLEAARAARTSSNTSRRSLFGTVLAALIAVVIAVPLAIAVALFTSHLAPRRLALPLGYIVDLLAAIPSIIYGLWGIFFLGPAAGAAVCSGSRTTSASSRSSRGPPRPRGAPCSWPDRAGGDDPADHLRGLARGIHPDAAQAPGGRPRPRGHPLGDDPDDRPAVRQVGDRQRVDARPWSSPWRDHGRDDHPLGLRDRHVQRDRLSNPSTIAANIALDFPESSGLAVNALVATGLVLFVITLLVNMAARAVINRQGLQ